MNAAIKLILKFKGAFLYFWNSPLLKSKKARMTIIGVLVSYILLPLLNAKLGLGLDPETLTESIYAFLAYLAAQGAADFRKEAKPNWEIPA